MSSLFNQRGRLALAWRPMAACAVVLGAMAGPASAAYPPGIYSLTLTGLPAGLDVEFQTRLLRCVDPLDFMPSGSVQMQPRLVWSLERVEASTGLQYRLVSRTVYDGQVQPSLPLPAGPCLGADGGNHDLELRAVVRGGTDPARPLTREVYALPRVMLNSNLHFTQHLAARSTFSAFTLPAGQTGPITITRGVVKVVEVDNLNMIGTRDTRTPSLAILLTSGPVLNRLLARLWLNASGRACITAGGSTVCQGSVPAAPSGGIVHAGIELQSIDHLRTAQGLPANTSRAQFQFKLPASFPAGTFDLVASADDNDPMPYLVDGVPTTLDLLPWQAAVHSVAVQ